MKHLLIFLLLFPLSGSLRAEYMAYDIQFEYSTISGETKVGFISVASAYLKMDSLENTDYLKKALNANRNNAAINDSLVYFTGRLHYEYSYPDDEAGGKHKIYHLVDKQSIALSLVTSISIIEMTESSYLSGISSPLTMQDTSWTQQAPVSSYSFGAYLCYHQIFIHEQSSTVDEILQLLQEKMKEIEESDLNSGNGDSADEAINALIEKLYGEKVVVVTECTC